MSTVSKKSSFTMEHGAMIRIEITDDSCEDGEAFHIEMDELYYSEFKEKIWAAIAVHYPTVTSVTIFRKEEE